MGHPHASEGAQRQLTFRERLNPASLLSRGQRNGEGERAAPAGCAFDVDGATFYGFRAIGIVNENVLPAPTMLSTPMAPP